MSFKRFLAAACSWALVTLPAASLAEDDDDEQQAAARQLEFMMDSVRHFQVVAESEPQSAWQLHPKPLLRWTNPVGGAPDGIVVLWADGDRPTLAATVFQNKGGNWMQEYYSFYFIDP